MIINPYRFTVSGLTDYLFSQMSDDFNDNSTDLSKWIVGARVNQSDLVAVSEVNNRVEIQPPNDAAANGVSSGYVSRLAYDLTDRFISFGHPQYLGGTTTSRSVRFGAFSDANTDNYIEIAYGSIRVFRVKNNGTVTGVENDNSISTNDKFYRISHTSFNDKIYFFLSTDGINWTLKTSVNRGSLDITAMRFFFQAGLTSSAAVSPAAFDDFIAGETIISGTFDDNFNDNSRDTIKWNTGGFLSNNSAVLVAEINNQLEITPAPSGSAIALNGYLSANSYNFTDKFIQVEMKTAQSGNASSCQFAVYIDSSNYFAVVVHGASYASVTRSVVGGTDGFVTFSYSATNMRFFRIRHQSSDDKIYWESSPDGATWAVMRSLARPLTVTSMKVAINAGNRASTGVVAPLIFDNFISNLA